MRLGTPARTSRRTSTSRHATRGHDPGPTNKFGGGMPGAVAPPGSSTIERGYLSGSSGGSSSGSSSSGTTRTTTTPPKGVKVKIHWSATGHGTPGSGGSRGHKVIPTYSELDVPGKTSTWDHQHHVRHRLSAVAAHRSFHE